ncbi:MAG: alkaline phosphatase PhoX [Aridibacter sp.]
MKRRDFLQKAGLASGGLALACSGLTNRATLLGSSENLEKFRAIGYGDLFPTPTKNTGETFISLPKGFEYNAFGKKGKKMSDDLVTPPAHDGMATFDFGNEIRLVRNHEVTNSHIPIEGSAIGAKPYDETAGGGTTTLVVNAETRELVRDFVSLSGTLMNCSGGRTPWGSWISCEEETLGKTVITLKNGSKIGGFNKPHGYCFEVPSAENSTVEAIPLKAMGRFVHEAIAVDKKSGIVYLTEDNRGGVGFYRFLPNRKTKFAEGGKLQILKVKGVDNFDARTPMIDQTSFSAEWVTIDNPDPEEADTQPRAVLEEGLKKGAATFTRLEGCDIDETGRVYFTSTDGGNLKSGQIWAYEPTNLEEGNLRLLFESPSFALLDMPDNVCFQPNSKLLYICEDGNYPGLGRPIDNFVKILTPSGQIAEFAKIITPDFSNDEFAGSTFSKDGKTLFVNIQNVGVTLAIWGDWGNFEI